MIVCMVSYIRIADHQGGQVDFNLTAFPVLVDFKYSVKESKRCIIFLSWTLPILTYPGKSRRINYYYYYYYSIRILAIERVYSSWSNLGPSGP